MANQPSKYSKFLIGAASAALVASAVAPVASAADFKDTKGNTHETAIDALSDAGVIKGYPDGTFLPNKTLTRSDVVKMLGKWLVNTQGFEVPTDYKTKPRFADQTSKTNDELLKYSAVVKDNGVFNGLENGTLDATADITRENMALVLVRAFDTVHKTDLVAYVAEKEFNKDVTDRATAKAEARPYIDVLDFFDITNPVAPKFNPKDTTTRGQFASFLYKTTNVEISDINAEVDSIKATNNTTVEVTFKTEVEDIKALDFAIEGLTVSNASVKQTNDKVVVLTTSAQEGDKAYTVTANGSKLGSFKGVSAVVPTAINVTTPSVQGVIGKEVTVSAQVTVAEGQSKAGIPVTFNIVNDSSNLNSKIEVEAFTNSDGVASYSYTRYYANNDNVAAYATSKSSVVSAGKVYWASAIQLAVSEITTGNELANETKKSYKVSGNANSTYYVAIKENLNVAPDKIVKVQVQNHGEVNFTTPYVTTTGAVQLAKVTTNANGEGTFTVYGSNLSATPIVYAPESTPTTPATYTYNKLDLQAEAPTVKFSQIDTLAIAVVGEGTADSAAYSSTPVKSNQVSVGGRTYTATVTDKNGKIAPEGTTAYVTFDFSGSVYFSTGSKNFETIVEGSVHEIKVGKEGKAQFRVAGKGATTFAKPTVFLNTAGTVTPAKLDAADVQTEAEVTYFKGAVVTNAVLNVTDENGRTITSTNANTDAYFVYQSVDQNGFAYSPNGYTLTPGTSTIVYKQVVNADGTIYFVPETVNSGGTITTEYVLAFDVTSTFGNAEVKDALGVTLPAVQNLGKTKTYHVKSDSNGKAVIRVTSQSTDTVSVNVTGASNILPTKTASVSFVDSQLMPDVYSGTVDSFNSLAGTLKFAGKNSVSIFGNNIVFTKGTEVIANYDAFIDLLKKATGPVSITRTVKDGVTTFNIYNIAASGTKPVDTAAADVALKTAKVNLLAAIKTANDKDVSNYKAATVTSYKAAIAAAQEVSNNEAATLDQLKAAVTVLNEEVEGLLSTGNEKGDAIGPNAPVIEVGGEKVTLTFTSNVSATNLTVVTSEPATSTVARSTSTVLVATFEEAILPENTITATVKVAATDDNKAGDFTYTFKYDTASSKWVVVTPSEVETALQLATRAVAKAEASKLQADVTAAQKLVTALPIGTDKTNLQNRITAIQVEVPGDKELTAQELNAEILIVLPGTYSVTIFLTESAKVSATKESTLTLKVAGKPDLTAKYNAEKNGFIFVASGYTENQLKNATISVHVN